jgi:glycosyltransferase involved in cell wall biosynthesis
MAAAPKKRKLMISVIIPTFNEAANISEVISGVKRVLGGEYDYEIIVVDKHSNDGTMQIAKGSGAKVLFDDIGKGSALVKGFNAAKGDVVISMDADLSHRSDELRLLIAGIEAGYDVCMGSRFLTGGGSDDMPLIRRLGNKFFVSIVNVIYGSHYSDMCYGYRSFGKEVAQKLDLKEKGFGIETEISINAQKKRLRILEVPSFEKKRASGEAHLRTFSDGWIILKAIIRSLRT